MSTVDEFDRTVHEHITSLHQQISTLTRANQALSEDVITLLQAVAVREGRDLKVVALEHLGRMPEGLMADR